MTITQIPPIPDILLHNQSHQSHQSDDTMHNWADKYYNLFVVNASPHTQRAKKGDIERFLQYFTDALNTDKPDFWTPAISRGFQNHLINHRSLKTNKQYTATTVNRIIATVQHFGTWLFKYRGLLAGKPFEAVKIIQINEPTWNGLSNLEIVRLKTACEIRLNTCKKLNQNPLLETTIFYILLTTGIRVSELTQLNIDQYYDKSFHNIKRKGKKVTTIIPIPQETRRFLDQYLTIHIAQMDQKLSDNTITPYLQHNNLHTHNHTHNSQPLFVSKSKIRITTRDVARICERIAKQASAYLPNDQRFHLAPHMLRHSFLKRVADKHGVHIAQELSGNVSIKEIFRYTKPSYAQKQQIVESLY